MNEEQLIPIIGALVGAIAVGAKLAWDRFHVAKPPDPPPPPPQPQPFRPFESEATGRFRLVPPEEDQGAMLTRLYEVVVQLYRAQADQSAARARDDLSREQQSRMAETLEHVAVRGDRRMGSIEASLTRVPTRQDFHDFTAKVATRDDVEQMLRRFEVELMRRIAAEMSRRRGDS